PADRRLADVFGAGVNFLPNHCHPVPRVASGGRMRSRESLRGRQGHNIPATAWRRARCIINLLWPQLGAAASLRKRDLPIWSDTALDGLRICGASHDSQERNSEKRLQEQSSLTV